MESEGGALTEEDWRELDIVRKVLQVGTFFPIVNCVLIFQQLPHLFQQALSFEKTPTLCSTVPAFEILQASLTELQKNEDHAEFVIQAGIEKLNGYCTLALRIPAYYHHHGNAKKSKDFLQTQQHLVTTSNCTY